MDPFESRLALAWPVAGWADLTVVIAVSGGADSMALLRAMAAIRPPDSAGTLVVAHCNHRLRGAASDEDERFVVDACRQLGLRCEVGRCMVAAKDQGDGLEATARHARYEFLQVTAEHVGARYVVTAHTADDQAETILHRVVRGTGIAGLSGISRVRRLTDAVTLLRPLLAVRRAEVVGYLRDLGQQYREDESNKDRRFTRNRLRHGVLPRLAEINPGVVEALVRLGQLAGEAQSIVDALAQAALAEASLERSPQWLRLDAPRLLRHSRYVVREALLSAWKSQDWPLQEMGYDEWESLAEMVSTPGASRTFPGGVHVTHTHGEMQLAAP